MASIKQVRDLKQEIVEAKSEKSKLEGKLEELMDQLKRNFDVPDMVEAQKLLEKKVAEAVKLETQFKEALTSLEEQVEW